MQEKHDFVTMIPISARSGAQVEVFEDTLKKLLPEGDHIYDADQFTDRSVKFLCAELLREKIFRSCGQELPYSTTVEIESYKEEENLVRMHALITVEKDNHKRMIIGDKGHKLKEMATAARLDMEKLIGQKIFLKCYCKVKTGWSDDERLLKQLGYDY